NQGTFVLRIDDTDQQRNVEAALAPILDALRWLGLDWDEGPEAGGEFGPYFQSQRRELYDQALQQLLQSGHAYRDFEPPEGTRQQPEAAEKGKRPYLGSRQARERSDARGRQHLAEAAPHVVRLKGPRARTVAIDDHIRGHVEWDCGLMA